jgi:7-cyano-7-deazaguanine synthase in queuosine biosynthesis/intein/homing endonuclease
VAFRAGNWPINYCIIIDIKVVVAFVFVGPAKAVVLLSGGLDSATALAVARSQGFDCFALSVDYGQRHAAELNAAASIAASARVAEHRVISVHLADTGQSALTDPTLDVPVAPTEGIPITYVPARNTILLSLALGWAEVLGAEAIFIGVNARDYSVSGAAKVWIRDSSGSVLARIEDVHKLPPDQYETVAVDPASLQLVWRRVLNCFKHNVSGKRCFRIRLERGQEIEISEDHCLFTINDAAQITPIAGNEIRVGIPLVAPFDLSCVQATWCTERAHIDLRVQTEAESAVPRNSSCREQSGFLVNRLGRTRVPLTLPITAEFLRIVGLWLAEGGKEPGSSSRSLAFSIGGLDGAPALLQRYFGSFGIQVRKSSANDFDYVVHSSVACEMFRRLELFGTAKAGDKKFPAWFWTLSQRQRRIVVAGLWDGDGAHVFSGEAAIHQKSHQVIDDLYHCFLLDGIFPSLKHVRHEQKRLALTRSADIARFLELYPLRHTTKRMSLELRKRAIGKEKATGLWKCAGVWSAVSKANLPPGRKTRIYNMGGKYEASVRAQRRAFAYVPDLAPLVDSKLAFLRVVSVEPVEHEYMYDLSVEGAENFLANGLVAHNSGYPDCRPEFIDAFQRLATLATKTGVQGKPVEVRAPLIDMSKAEIIKLGVRLGVPYEMTVSCYQADDAGRACGRCDSCRLRREGFDSAGVPDPTVYR